MFLGDKPHGWCRKCGYMWWPDSKTVRLTPEEREQRARVAQELAEQRRISISEMRQKFHDARSWEPHHLKAFDGEGLKAWAERGIPEAYVAVWELGYDLRDGGSLVIPIWSVGRRVLNVKRRMLHPGKNVPRYTQEMAGVPGAVFVANYFLDSLDGVPVLVVEGEIKAMAVTVALARHMRSTRPFCVAGLPGRDVSVFELDILRQANPIWIAPDPDVLPGPAAQRVASLAFLIKELRIPPKRVIELPDKIDDLMNRGHLSAETLIRRLRSSL